MWMNNFSRRSSSTAGPTPTCAGHTYTIGTSDTCESISEAASVAIDRMIALNNLDYGCKTLTAGNSLCLQDTCTLHIVKANETCDDITSSQSYSVVQLVSWNP